MNRRRSLRAPVLEELSARPISRRRGVVVALLLLILVAAALLPATSRAAFEPANVVSVARWSADPNDPQYPSSSPRYTMLNGQACKEPTQADREGVFRALAAPAPCLLGRGIGDAASVWDNTIKIRFTTARACTDTQRIEFERETGIYVPVDPTTGDEECSTNRLRNFLIPRRTGSGGQSGGSPITPVPGFAGQVRLIGPVPGDKVFLGKWDFNPPPSPNPGPPIVSNAQPADGAVRITIAPGSPAGARYIAYATAGDHDGPSCTVPDAAGGTCTIEGLSNGATYRGEAIASSADGLAESGPTAFEVRPLPAPPAPPVIAALAAGDRSVTAHVEPPDASQAGTAKEYIVTTVDGPQECTVADAPLAAPGDPRHCTVTDLTNGIPVRVTAVAKDEFGQMSGPSAASDLATPLPPFTGVAATRCSAVLLKCSTDGQLPDGAASASQVASPKRVAPGQIAVTARCTIGSPTDGRMPFGCDMTLPSYGEWMFTTQAQGTVGLVQKQELIMVRPPSFEGRDGSISVECSDERRSCASAGVRPSRATGIVQRATATDELTQTAGRPNRTAACSYPSATTYGCSIGLDYGQWDLVTEAKNGRDLLARDERTVTINAPEFGSGSALPGAGGSYVFTCAPWDGDSQVCDARGNTPPKTSAVTMVAQRLATSTTTSQTLRDDCRIAAGAYQCAVDLTRGQWTVTTTAYTAAQKIIARQVENITVAPPFGDPSVGGSARIECERRSGFNSLHFICVAEGTKINQPALYQLRANLSGSSTKVIGACRWDSTEVWQCRAFPRNARGKWRLTFQAVDEGGVLAQGAVTLKIPGPKQEWSQG